MSLVKLFHSTESSLERKNEVLELLEININAFMTNPTFTYELHPLIPHHRVIDGETRVSYTSMIIYSRKNK